MFDDIKKEWKEIRSGKEHMAYVPPDTNDLEPNFREIKKLIERTGSQRRIEGNPLDFTIRQRKYYAVLTVIITVISIVAVLFGAMMLVSEPFLPVGIIGLVWVCIGGYNLFSKSPVGNYLGIQVNNYTKTLTVFDDNYIRRHFVPKQDIPFESITNIWAKQHTIRGKGTTYHWQKIYIEYDGRQRQIMALPCGEMYYVNHEVFMTCLMRIMKRTKPA